MGRIFGSRAGHDQAASPRGEAVAVPDETLSDDALLVLFANGDPQAARQLTARLGPRVYGVAMRVLGDRDEAEDVAQEAMMRLWKMAPDWRPGQAQVSTWLYRVAMNLCLDRKRRGARAGAERLDDVPEPMDPAPGAPELMQDGARAEALQRALMVLPDRQRQAVVLRHIEELSNPEIAEIMEISVDAVESLTARGKRALAAGLAGRREELGYNDG
ncbi:RNA polymerase sigma factor [Pseudodonghicola xiamenensis]|uniref:RNA polymerase sigma subunit ECF family protein n=1 Tax=Pseudodonghicola xiamenensis TaxID=337702 RepID=A0A8J3HAK1_9RHOB|nr:RNA polymerase sigma factor [Pseudodonghicola xiamenensis]GHG97397.1 RNA polymerase sigma subunit ECF family protein [Pseudodonghicola xiamenensis]